VGVKDLSFSLLKFIGMNFIGTNVEIKLYKNIIIPAVA
jgi:hypothetical protein